MNRRTFTGGAVVAALAGPACAALPAVLQRPAWATPHAQGAAMLAMARAGRRLAAAGERGIVLTSDDQGRPWSQVQVSLTALRFADERRGWAAGHLCLLLRSGDRGGSFKVLRSPYKGSFFGLLAARSGTLVAYGLRGNAFRSGDYGSNRSVVDSRAPVSISAGIERADGTLLLAQNGELLVSRDDGRKFERRPAEPSFPAAAMTATEGGALVLAGLRGLKPLEIA